MTAESLSEPQTLELVHLRDYNTRVWCVQREVKLRRHDGTEETQQVERRIVEKGCGICCKDEQGSFQPSNPHWEPTPDGFVLRECAYRLSAGKTLADPIVYTTRGTQLRFRPALLKASGGSTTTVVATVDASVTGIVDTQDTRRLLFPRAFGPLADVEILARKGSLHQNVILNRTPTPALHSEVEDARLSLYTELSLDDFLSDNSAEVRFGSQPIRGEGASFEVAPSKAAPIAFYKTTLEGNGGSKEVLQHFFAESPVYSASGGEAAALVGERAERRLFRDPQTNATYLVESVSLAFLDQANYPVVWDFWSVSGNYAPNEPWIPAYTYRVTADLYVSSGTLQILPGTVVKLDPWVSIYAAGGAIHARGEPYDYIVFTKTCDDNCGEIVEELDRPDDLPYICAIYLMTASPADSVVQYCKMGYGYFGVLCGQSLGADNPIAHNIIRGQNLLWIGIKVGSGANTSCHNNLITDSTWLGIQYYTSGGSETNITNNTVDGANVGIQLNYSTFKNVTDNLLSHTDFCAIDVTSSTVNLLDHNGYWIVGSPVAGAAMGPNSVDLPDPNSPYDPCSVGSYYLNNDDPGGGSLRDRWEQGAPQPRSAEAAGLLGREFTVNKPNTAPALITSNATWSQIDTDTDIVDIGYHHNRVDYVVDDIDTVVSNGALTIEPATVVVIYGQDRAIWAEWYGRIIANGNLYTGDCPLISSKRCVSMGIESAHKDASVCPGGNPNDGQIGLLLFDDSGFSSQILGVTFRGLYVGVSSNVRTPEPIASNRFLTCFLGVDVWDWFGDGLPDVRNNLFYDNFRAIQVASFYPATSCTVRNNTVDRCGGGVKIYGSEYQYEEFWPWVFIHDNLFTYTSPNYAIDGTGHWRGSTTNNGFWGNDLDYPAWMEVTDSAPITSHPYEGDGQPYGRWYLDQDCGAVDAGSAAACTSALNPYTTCTDGRYDQLAADVGFHYPNSDGPQNPSPTAPTITIESPAPHQLVTGDWLVDVNVEDTLGPTPGIGRVELYIDYGPAAALSGARRGITWPSHECSNGTHVLQAIAIDLDGEVGASAPITVDTDNLVHCFQISRPDAENFGGGSGPLYFEGLVKPGATWSVYVLDAYGVTVRNIDSGTSDGFSGAWWGENNALQAVPGGLYTLEVEASASPPQYFSHVCCVNDVPPDQCMLLILAPIADGEYDALLLQPVIECAAYRRIPYRVHWGEAANWSSLSEILVSESCQYLYVAAHGSNDYPPGCETTSFWLGKKANVGVYSDLSRFEYDEAIWGTAYSLASLGLTSSTKMKFVWMDACDCGHQDPRDPANNDMAVALGISTEHWTPDYDQCYLGFTCPLPGAGDWPFGEMDRTYTQLFWEDLASSYYVDQAYWRMWAPERLPLMYMTSNTMMYITPNAVVLPFLSP